MDINCDLGEGERPEKTRRLLRMRDFREHSLRRACGEANARCAPVFGYAAEFKVNAGAHPGFPDRETFRA